MIVTYLDHIALTLQYHDDKMKKKGGAIMDKKADIKFYYNYVRESSMINDSFGNRTKDQHPFFQYNAAECVFNKYLENNFKISVFDSTDFIPIYKKYSDWLLAQYISQAFLFNDICSKYDLSKIKDQLARHDFFLAKTFKFFMDEKIGIKDYYDFTDHTDYTSVAAYKMYLGALEMMCKIKGYTAFEYEIEQYKEIIIKMQGAKK